MIIRLIVASIFFLTLSFFSFKYYFKFEESYIGVILMLIFIFSSVFFIVVLVFALHFYAYDFWKSKKGKLSIIYLLTTISIGILLLILFFWNKASTLPYTWGGLIFFSYLTYYLIRDYRKKSNEDFNNWD